MLLSTIKGSFYVKQSHDNAERSGVGLGTRLSYYMLIRSIINNHNVEYKVLQL